VTDALATKGTLPDRERKAAASIAAAPIESLPRIAGARVRFVEDLPDAVSVEVTVDRPGLAPALAMAASLRRSEPCGIRRSWPPPSAPCTPPIPKI
jgi:hypothetical protein